MGDMAETGNVASSSSLVTSPAQMHDYSNPLYLHPSDSSNTALITCVLTGCENYSIWSIAMSFSLSGKNKIDFVEGLIPMPSDPEGASRWIRCNSVIMTWLLNSVNKTIYNSLVYYSKSPDVWRDLRKAYSKVDGTMMFRIIQDISRISQNNDSVSEYFMSLKMLWDQLASIKSGTRCVCAASVNIVKDDNSLKLMQFLMGLNEKISHVRSNILMTVPLPDAMTAFNIVSQEESHMSLTGKPNSGKLPSAFVSKKFFSKSKAKNPNLKCTHCGGSRHLIERCFKLIGCPEKREWNKSKPVNKFSNSADTSCVVPDNTAKAEVDTSVLTPDVIEQLIKLVNVQKNEEGARVNMAGFQFRPI